ncbi:universal stress protein [Candidatus Micrarchaeota archaeon]|nr:universal stress protein [Candidatus Micrarchaeota archaeon]
MYSCILVGLDGSKESWKALDQAIAIGKNFKSKLIVASVIPFASDAPVRKEFMALRRKFSRELEKAISMAKKKRVSAKPLLLDGEAGEELLDAAVKNKCDLIVVGRERSTVYGRLLFGRVSYYVVERAKIPVLVVK